MWHPPARGRCSVHLALGFFVIRGKAPVVCLAQPNGLGNGYYWNLRANGPAICLEYIMPQSHAQDCAFSVSHSLRENVDQYIRNQAEHHARISYKDEYRRICEKHEIEIDERYVWD